MSNKDKKKRNRIIVAIVLFVIVYFIAEFLSLDTWLGSKTAALLLEFGLFVVPYLVAGYDVLLRAGRNVLHGQVFDENSLMSIATIGAFALVLFPNSNPHMAEGAAVMLFYQVGGLFEHYAVDKSRKSIAQMMDIAPDYANVERGGALIQVDPNDVILGENIVVKPGERIPLDGVIVKGTTQIDTAGLTGESIPQSLGVDDEVISGCVNLTGLITVQVSKAFYESTVSRILELVENAADKKAQTESFITRFARYYTPAVVIVAAVLALFPPLLMGANWADWIQRGLIFLVVSCPCALVISVPLSFFGGIGAASRVGVLIKGGNYLEVLASVKTVVFDKTGTLTNGTFDVVSIEPQNGFASEELLDITAHAEAYSNHPIAESVRRACQASLALNRVKKTTEISGQGVEAIVDKHFVLVGNAKLMQAHSITISQPKTPGTILHVAIDGTYAGCVVIADTIKTNAKQAISALHTLGIKHTIMLTGDQADVASTVSKTLGIDEYRAQLLPQNKVEELEKLIDQAHATDLGKETLAYIGDGINDAPVLARADVGIAMGAMGSDAAIEAADVVLMNDNPSDIARAIHIARKTMRIVYGNITFALGVKFLVLILAALGMANMWLAVFADVGVTVIAILNAMRAMNVRK